MSSGIDGGVAVGVRAAARPGAGVPGRLLSYAGMAALVAAIALYPLGRLFVEALRDPAADAQGLLGALHPLLDTVIAVAASTPIAVGLGTVFALVTARSRAAWRRPLFLAVLLPLIIAPFIGAFAWIQAYGPAGLSDLLVHWTLPGLFGATGVVLLLAVHAVPFPFAIVGAALAGGRMRHLELAARASGARPATVLRTVTLPPLRPAIAAGALLAAISAASDFGIPAIVGLPGRFSTLTTSIYADLAFASQPGSFSAALAQALLLCLLIAPALAFAGRMNLAPAAGASGEPESGRGWLGAVLVLLYAVLVSVLPLVAVVLVALTRAYGLPPVPANWSSIHFLQALSGRNAVALEHSLVLAGLAGACCCLFGVGVALAARRGTFGRLLEAAVALNFALPGSVTAVAAILAWDRWLYGTLALILMAYLARFWALGERPVAAALAGLKPGPVLAARASGAGGAAALRVAAWPTVAPALAAAFFLVFIQAFHEVTVSGLLYGPGSVTVAVAVLSSQQAGDAATTAAIAVLLTVVVLLAAAPVLLNRRLARWMGV